MNNVKILTVSPGSEKQLMALGDSIAKGYLIHNATVCSGVIVYILIKE